jgi:hypothetical protein
MIFIEKEDIPDMMCVFNHIKDVLEKIASSDKFARNGKFGALAVTSLCMMAIVISKVGNSKKENLIECVSRLWDAKLDDNGFLN